MKTGVLKWSSADTTELFKAHDPLCYACDQNQTHTRMFHCESVKITKAVQRMRKPRSLTIAVRVCAGCNNFLGVQKWEGPNATTEDFVISHGLCDKCVAKIEEQIEEFDACA